MTSIDDNLSSLSTAELYDQSDGDNTCLLCEQPKYQLLHEVIHFDIPLKFQRCQCGLIKQTPMPNERFFAKFFNSAVFVSSADSKTKKIWGYYDYFKDERCRLATSRLRYWRLRRYFEVGRPLNIMKIGPGGGSFLHVARNHGHNVIGCDVSKQFIDFAQKNYGLHIDRGRFEQIPYEDNQFDAILLLNVIENVPNQVEFLDSIRSRVRPGGVFVLNYVEMSGNIIAKIQKERYFLFRPPVCYGYTKDVMTRLLQKFDFQVESTFRDIRFFHLEKMLTLLDWPSAFKLAKMLRMHRLSFPFYAYPSKIVVARRLK